MNTGAKFFAFGGTAGGGSGDVVGPASSTDNALVRFDGTTGKLLQGSVVTISDAGRVMAGAGTVTNPTYSFAAETTKGVYDNGAGEVGLSASSTQIWTANSSRLQMGGTGGAYLKRNVGTYALPTFSFSGNTGDGIGSLAANSVYVSAAGGRVMNFTSSLITADKELGATLGVTNPSDVSSSFGANKELKIEWCTTDADAHSARIGLPNGVGASANLGMIWIGSQADVIGTDLGIETGDSYGIAILQEGGAFAAGLAPVDGVATVFGVGTKSFQMLNPASGVVFSIASDGTDTLITPESGTKLALAGIVKTTDGVRGKISTANVTNPPTDAELDTAFGTPATVGAGFTALLDDNGAGTAVYQVGSDGTNWWYTEMTKAV